MLFVVSPYVAIRILSKPSSRFVYVALWSRLLLLCFGINVTQHGEIPQPPYLLVSNHMGWVDIPALYTLLPVHFISKAEIKNWLLIGQLAKLAGTLFHERGSHHSSGNINQVSAEHLCQGQAIAIFPEGRTWHDDDVHTFHGRLLQSAKDAKVPILPVCLRFILNSKRTALPAFRANENMPGNLWRLLIAPPMTAEIWVGQEIIPDQDRKSLARQAQQQVHRLYHQ